MSYLKYWLSLFLLSSTVFAQTYQGELEVLVADDFTKQQAKTLYKLHEGIEVYTLEIPKSLINTEFLTGTKVIIEGQEKAGFTADNKIIHVESILKEKGVAAISKKYGFENRKALVLLVDFNNIQATKTVKVKDVDSIMYETPRSMQKNILTDSFGQVFFNRDTNNDGKADIETVKLDYAAKGCSPDQWARDALSAATQMGIKLNLYQHFMFVIPKDVNCNWGGLGHLGCGTSCYTWIRAYEPQGTYAQIVYVHEIGHNLGMHHSATDTNNDGVPESEYGDAACIMGTGDFQYLKQANAPHRDQMHWFDMFSNRLKVVSGDGVFAISPLDAGIDHTGLLTLKIQRNSSETYYVSFRRDIGPFGPGAPAYLDKVNIHRVVAGDSHSYFIKAIGAGESFVDPKINLNISVISLDKNFALISVKK
ncbi:MAG: hypothetical protein EPN84_08560 [Legionella sp.]|nr:MAG: hypothetical protein EPN84_08560 [Legionella sp.]